MVAELGIPPPPQERIPERTCEQVVDVRVRLVVEQVLEVPKNSSQDRNLQGTVEQIPDDPVLEKAEQLVEVPETVSQERIQQRTVEQIVDASVPQAVEELAEVSKVFSQDGIQQRIVEQTIPATSLAETIVVVLVIQMQGTTQRGVNTHVQHVANAVEVEKPKIIELTVQRKKFTIQEKINRGTKPIEFPQAQFLDKAGDMPVVVQRQVSTAQTVQKAVEVPPLQSVNRVVDIPVLAQRQISMETVQKTIEISQLKHTDHVDDVPVVLIVQVPQVQVVAETVEIPQLRIVEKIDETPEFDVSTGENPFAKVTGVITELISRLEEEDLDADTAKHSCKLETVVSHTVDGEIPMLQSEFDALSKRQLDVGTVRAGERDVFAKVKADLEQVACETCVRDNTATVAKVGDLSSTSGSMHQQRTSEECKQVKKDATGWTVVTRNKRQRKMVQIFVKVDEAKVTPMDVSLTDGKVEDVIRQVQKGEDVYVTMQGKVLRRNEKLKSCGVTDGCTIQVASRMRGGGRHKDKRSKTDTKRGMDESGQKDQQVESLIDKCQEATQAQKDEMIQLFEENDAYRRMITMISEAEDEEHEIQSFRKQLQSGVDEERAKLVELGMRWGVEARKRGRGAEQEQRRQEEQRQRRHEQQGQNTGQEQGKKGKQVSFGEEEQTKETWAESTDKLEATRRLTEVQTGRGSAGLVRGGDEKCRTDETSRKGKGKGNGGKGEHEGKGGGFGHKGKHPEMREREEERIRMAPNVGAGGSHPQATSDPGEREMAAGGQQCNEESGEEKKETRGMRWADCEDDEGKEQEEQETKELTSEKPPGLEQKEDEEREKRAQEACEDEERRAQEAREEERRAQEAREEERRAQEAREEERRAQEAREEERRAQEAHEEERKESV